MTNAVTLPASPDSSPVAPTCLPSALTLAAVASGVSAADVLAYAAFRSNETARALSANSLTKLDLYGALDNGEGYSLRVTEHGKAAFRVTWNVRTLEVAKSYKTVRSAYWRAIGWSASSFRTLAKAEAFAATKLAALRDWSDKRGTVAA